MKNIHLIGIAGVGMRALAQLLLQSGYSVSGSDLTDSAALNCLRQQGAKIFIGHSANNLSMSDTIIRSSAIKDDHVEWLAAKSMALKMMHRSEMLSLLCQGRDVIAVTGSHGKTSTTAMIVHALRVVGKDPCFAIGADWDDFACGANLSKGKIFVVEADESDASFLNLQPAVGVVLNLEREHLSFYNNSLDNLQNAFKKFMQNSAVMVYNCAENQLLDLACSINHGRVLSFSYQNSADICVRLHDKINNVSQYSLCGMVGEWKVFGQHQLQNLAAAYAAVSVFGVGLEDFIKAMRSFSLPGRRFQELGCIPGVGALVIDDYGHHPNEIAATIASVRAKYPERSLVMAFQPHKYTRLRDEFSAFIKVLSLVDSLILLPVYSAGEALIKGYTSGDLAGCVDCVLLDDIESAREYCLNILCADDLLLCQGAGDITLLAQQLNEVRYV